MGSADVFTVVGESRSYGVRAGINTYHAHIDGNKLEYKTPAGSTYSYYRTGDVANGMYVGALQAWPATPISLPKQ
jgi:hypothetical protein